MHELLEEIPPFFYGPADSQDQTVSFGEHGGVGKRIASDFYSASNIAEARLPDASMGPILHASGLDALLRATQSFVEALVSRQEGLSESDLALTSALMDVIAQLVSARSDLTLSWNPSSWLSAVSSTIDQMSGSQAGFDCLAASLHTLVALHHSAAQPVIDIDTQHIMTAFLNKVCEIFCFQKQKLIMLHSSSSF